MEFLDKHHVQIAAAGLFCLGGYYLTTGDWAHATHALLTAAGMLGLHLAIPDPLADEDTKP